MTTAHAYLTEKAKAPKEWLRRDPRTTHPDILQLVRDAQRTGLFYDDDVERYANERIPGMPPHQPHGTDNRDPLVSQLGHEVYIAKGLLRDEEAARAEADALANGWQQLDPDALVNGERYLVRFGTVYVGRDVPEYGEPLNVRAFSYGDGMLLRPKGHSRGGFRPGHHALIKPEGGDKS